VTFIGGSPNSEGVSPEELAMVSEALSEAPDGGLFVVGVHAPLFNPSKEEYPYFLRPISCARRNVLRSRGRPRRCLPDMTTLRSMPVRPSSSRWNAAIRSGSPANATSGFPAS
jgi:hypothetical protein